MNAINQSSGSNEATGIPSEAIDIQVKISNFKDEIFDVTNLVHGFSIYEDLFSATNSCEILLSDAEGLKEILPIVGDEHVTITYRTRGIKKAPDEQYRERIADPGRIECRHSMYSIIQYSKFKWLTAAADSNPFDSKWFFWLDAGGSRFFDDYDVTLDYPSPNAMESFEAMGDQFLVQMNMEYYPDLAGANKIKKSYLLNNRSYVLGSMFGGGINSLKKVANDVENILVNEMIANDYVNNEQIALGYLVKENPDDYAIYERTNHKHAAIFEELGKR